MTDLTDTEVRIAWEKTGDGPPVLLIMGLGYARWAWNPLLAHLKDEFTVLTFDNRGIGESDKPPGPYSAAQMSADAAAVLDAANIESAHVIGSSLGGMIAQELAIDRPERVDRLVLASTTPGGSASFPMPEVTTRLIADQGNVEVEVALRRFVENALSPDVESSLVDQIVVARLENPQPHEAWLAQAAAGVSYDGSGRASEINAPTLIVHGRSDNVVDVRNADLLGSLVPNSQVSHVDGGHLFFWEHPDTAAGIISKFLSGS